MWMLLHGFTGLPQSWDPVVERMKWPEPPLRPILTGHGPNWRGVQSRTFAEEVARLYKLASSIPSPRLLAGYSLGARVSLGLLATHPSLFDAAVLIGLHPGLSTNEAIERRARDLKRIDDLKTRGLESFVDDWERQPLFESQRRLPIDLIERQRSVRLGHQADGLAHALRVLGLAAMPDYRAAFAKLRIPVTLMAGALDTKFVELVRSIGSRHAQARVWIVEGVGHNLLIEAPEAVAAALSRAEAEVSK